MFNFFKKTKPETISVQRSKFDHLIKVAKALPHVALPELIMGTLRPIQFEFILAVAEEGTDARPSLYSNVLFFNDILRNNNFREEPILNPEDYPLSLNKDIVLPWPWKLERFLSALATIGTNKGNPWKQDLMNHNVELWLPWRIGFVHGGNHSIAAGILAEEGSIIPTKVCDMSYLFERISTDGDNWYRDGIKVDKVHYWRAAAAFEIGRLMVNNGK